MITTIIFDFFDVFRTDSYKAWLAANNFERTGAFAEASAQADAGKITGNEFYHQISQAAGRLVTPEEVDASASVNMDMVAFARHLKTTYKTCLLSNAPSDFIRKILDDYNLEDIFDMIFISGETGLVKPNPEAFEGVLQAMGISAAQAVFIDDNSHNTEAATKLGIQSIVFTSVPQLKAALNDLILWRLYIKKKLHSNYIQCELGNIVAGDIQVKNDLYHSNQSRLLEALSLTYRMNGVFDHVENDQYCW